MSAAWSVLRAGRLIDGSGGPPISDASIVVRDGRIVYAGPARGAPATPPDARSLDASGMTVMPGLIDAHAHMLAYAFDLEQRLVAHATLVAFRTMHNLRATLDAGVTTVRDAGGIDAGYREAMDEGLITGPRLLVSGQGLAPTGALFDFHWGSGAHVNLSEARTVVRRYVDGVENVRLATRQLILSRVDVVKIVSTGSIFARTGFPPRAQYSPEELDAIIGEAHAAGVKVMCHAEGGPGLTNALRAGVDSIEHGFYLDDEMIDLMVRNGTYLVPTLSAAQGVVTQAERGAHVHDWAVANARKLLADPDLGFARAVRAGVRVAMGSDIFGANHGENALELEAMVKCGMTASQATVAATSAAADLLGISADTGTLAPGRAADLIIVDGDPLADIRVLADRARLRLVMRGGVVHRDRLSAARPVHA